MIGQRRSNFERNLKSFMLFKSSGKGFNNIGLKCCSESDAILIKATFGCWLQKGYKNNYFQTHVKAICSNDYSKK
jgi:hypothetical protein